MEDYLESLQKQIKALRKQINQVARKQERYKNEKSNSNNNPN